MTNVLLTNASPENVVISEGLPSSGDLGGPAQRSGIKVHENLETHFARKNCKWIYADKMGELFGEKGEL